MRSSTEACAWLEREDRRCMRELKDGLRRGLALFERHERDVGPKAGAELIAVASGLPSLVEAYYARLKEVPHGESRHPDR